MLARQLPKIEAMLREAADEVTAFADFPVSHWNKICSTNPLEGLNEEIKRRSDGASTPANGASTSRSARCGVGSSCAASGLPLEPPSTSQGHRRHDLADRAETASEVQRCNRGASGATGPDLCA